MAIFTFGDALGAFQGFIANALPVDTDLQIDLLQPSPFIDIVRLSADATESERAGRAYVLLSGTSERAADWGLTAQRATFDVACRASENAGGLPSATRPVPLQETLARKIELLCESKYSDVRDLGLLNIRCSREKEGFQDGENGLIHFVDLKIKTVFLAEG